MVKKPNRHKLTKKFIDSLSDQHHGLVVWDTEISGFALKVTGKGKKNFLLKYNNKHGQQRKPKIGDYGDITIDQARSIAREWKASIAKGGDPSAEKAKSKKAILFKDFGEDYFERAKLYKKQSSINNEYGQYKYHLVPAFGNKPLVAISKQDVQKWFDGLSHTKGAANKTLSILSAMLNDAERQELREIYSNPCRFIKRYKTDKIERYLSKDELFRLYSILDDIEDEFYKTGKARVMLSAVYAIRFALLTGMRKQEILELKWEYIDFENCKVHLPDSKTGKKTLNLSIQAVTLLKSIFNEKGNPYVFTGNKPGQNLKGFRKSFLKILKQADISNFRIHDMRHTYASIGISNGIDLATLGKTMGHSSMRSTERYAHLLDETKIKAVNKIGDVLSSQ